MGPGWLKVQNFSFLKNTKNPNSDFTIEIDDITDFAPLKKENGRDLVPPPLGSLYL